MSDVRGRIAGGLLALTLFLSNGAGAAMPEVPQPAASSPMAALPLQRSAEGDMSRGWVALAGILGVAGVAAIAFRRSKQGLAMLARRSPGLLVKVASVSLTSQVSAHLIRCDGRQYFVCCSGQQIVTLRTEDAVPAAEPTQGQGQA